RGNLEVQTEALTALLATAIFAVKHVEAQGYTADARATVAAIGRSLEAYQRERPDHRHIFPPSGKPIPKNVPRGTRRVTAEADWQAPGWKDIGFSLKEPSYYQYEFVTSFDGKKVTVRAHGDLDGDGKESLFELKLSVDPNGSVVMAPISVKD